MRNSRKQKGGNERMVNKEIVIQDLKNLIKSMQMDKRQNIKELEVKQGAMSSLKLIWEDKAE